MHRNRCNPNHLLFTNDQVPRYCANGVLTPPSFSCQPAPCSAPWGIVPWQEVMVFRLGSVRVFCCWNGKFRRRTWMCLGFLVWLLSYFWSLIVYDLVGLLGWEQHNLQGFQEGMYYVPPGPNMWDWFILHPPFFRLFEYNVGLTLKRFLMLSAMQKCNVRNCMPSGESSTRYTADGHHWPVDMISMPELTSDMF